MDEPSEVRGPLGRGDRLGRYEILALIGAGGMGVVYRARDPSLAREVALKRVRTDLVADPGMSRARLLREAQAMAQVSHPNVLPIYDVGVDGGDVFIAMELVHGGSLPQWLRERPRTTEAIVSAFIDVGRGLMAVHAAGLVHRDLKPSNVMMDGDRARVMDFGLARTAGSLLRETDQSPSEGESAAISSLSSQLTEAGSVLGTPAYMAPEQMVAEGEVDARADQYAFCVALFQALHGKLPFDATSMAELYRRKHHERVVATAPVQGLARRVDVIVRRGLAARPDARWPTMRALVDALLQARAPRWRPRGLLLAGAAAGVVGVGLLLVPAAGSSRCATEDSLAGVWDDDRREALHAAWEGSGVPYQAQAWAKLLPHLDAYAEGLRAQQRAVCEAHRDPEASTSESLDQRSACSSDRRRRLAAVVDALAQADAGVVEQALTWVTSLPRVQTCDQDHYLGGALAPPATPEQARAVTELREQLARVHAMAAAGDKAEARQEAQVVADAAESLGYGPLEAEALVQLGRLQDGEDAALGIATLSRGYFVAVEHGHDAVALDAALELVEESSQRAAFDEAAQWSRTAEALLQAVGDEPSLRARVLRQQGELQLALGHEPEAIAALEQAVALDLEVYGEGHPRVADVRLELGRTLRRQEGRELEARAMLDRALATAEVAYDPAHPSVAAFHNNLANVQVQLGELDEALAHYEQAEAIARAAHGEESPELAGYLANRAQIHLAREQFEPARELTTKALALWERAHGAESPQVMLALNNLGVIHQGLRDDASAASYFRRALVVARGVLGPTHPNVASLQRNLGEALVSLGRLDEAAEQLEQVRALAEQEQVAVDDLAMARFGLARVRWEQGDRAAAQAHAQAAHAALVGLGVVFGEGATMVRQWLDEHPQP